MITFDKCRKVNIDLPKHFGFSFDFSVSEHIMENFNSEKFTVLPGFCDVHVHFREPGFMYKETIETGSKAAAKGGYTAVCTMPNLNPVPDCDENLKIQTDSINKNSVIDIFPYGTITKGQKGQVLSEMDELKDKVIAFSDDGKGIQSESMMRSAMEKARSLNKIIAAHCEEEALLFGGYIHDGEYAKLHGHKGISSESEFRQIERDLKLAKETGCAYHVCHISAKESVELIRNAKKEGVDVTCETAPHYLILDDSDIMEEGRFKMNPPLRSKRDKEALIEGIIDGTIDMIATDHAPHSDEEKSKGLRYSPFGIVGLETAFASLYTNLVMKSVISLERLVMLMSVNPRIRFNIPLENSFSVWNLENSFKVESKDFISMGHATPFEGMEMYGINLLTVHRNKIVYNYQNNIE